MTPKIGAIDAVCEPFSCGSIWMGTQRPLEFLVYGLSVWPRTGLVGFFLLFFFWLDAVGKAFVFYAGLAKYALHCGPTELPISNINETFSYKKKISKKKIFRHTY